MRRILEHDIGEIGGRVCAIDRSRESLPHEFWEIPDVVDVCVGQEYDVDPGRIIWKRFPVFLAEFLATLK